MTVIHQWAQFGFLDMSAGNVLGSRACYQGPFWGEVTAEALSWEEGATSWEKLDRTAGLFSWLNKAVGWSLQLPGSGSLDGQDRVLHSAV